MTDEETAREALARLVADKHRPNGITLWCDAHRPDLEIAVRELGVAPVADALGMKLSSLYSYVEHRQMERRDMRVHKAAPVAAAPVVAPEPLPAEEEATEPTEPTARNGDAATEVKAKSVPYVLWTLARKKGWTIHEVDALLSARLKRVDDRSPAEWQAIADLYRKSPGLFVDAKGRVIEAKE